MSFNTENKIDHRYSVLRFPALPQNQACTWQLSCAFHTALVKSAWQRSCVRDFAKCLIAKLTLQGRWLYAQRSEFRIESVDPNALLMYKNKKSSAHAVTGTGAGGGAAAVSSPLLAQAVTGGAKQPVNKKTPPTKPAKGNKRQKGIWWSEEEVTMMLDIVARIKPTGGYMWNRVTEMYNSKDERNFRNMADLPYRDLESIRTKWKALKNMKKPTGDPDCPLNVVRAKRIARDIENGAGVFNLDDYDSNSDRDEDDENRHISSESESSTESPINLRTSLVVSETVFAVDSSSQSDTGERPLGSTDNFELQDAQFPYQSLQMQGDHTISSSFPAEMDRPHFGKSKPGKVTNSTVAQPSPRLGMSAEQLQEVANGLVSQKKDKKRKASQSNVPENPSITKKRALVKELRDIDDEYQANLLKLDEEKQRRHTEEMKRLDNQQRLAEMRYQAEAARSNALLSAIVMTATTISSFLGNPQLSRAIQSLAPHGEAANSDHHPPI